MFNADRNGFYSNININDKPMFLGDFKSSQLFKPSDSSTGTSEYIVSARNSPEIKENKLYNTPTSILVSKQYPISCLKFNAQGNLVAMNSAAEGQIHIYSS